MESKHCYNNVYILLSVLKWYIECHRNSLTPISHKHKTENISDYSKKWINLNTFLIIIKVTTTIILTVNYYQE